MSYRPGDAYYGEFTTCSSATGGAQNADAVPVATATRNGADDASFILTVTNLDPGRYRVSGTIPASYARGDSLQVSVAATVGGVAGKAVVDSLVLDSKRVGDLADYAGADTAGTATLLGRLSSQRATNLDNLDASVASRAPTSLLPPNLTNLAIDPAGRVDLGKWLGNVVSVDVNNCPNVNAKDWGGTLISGDLPNTTAPVSVVQIRQEMDLNSIRLANLDASVSSRSTYTGADTAGTATILARLTAQRAANLDALDAAISSRSSHSAADVWAVASRTLSGFGFQVTVGGYATGQDPATRIDAASADIDAIRARTDLIPAGGFPGQFSNLIVTSSGMVQIDGTQAVPATGNAPNSVNDCLNAARAQGFGKWVLNGTSLSLFAADGTTAVRTFVLDSVSSPTTRS